MQRNTEIREINGETFISVGSITPRHKESHNFGIISGTIHQREQKKELPGLLFVADGKSEDDTSDDDLPPGFIRIVRRK